MATKQCFNNLNSDLDFVSVDGAFADIIRGEARGKAINRSELLPMVTNAAPEGLTWRAARSVEFSVPSSNDAMGLELFSLKIPLIPRYNLDLTCAQVMVKTGN